MNETDSIVAALRTVAAAGDIPPNGHPPLAGRAADEIERLRKAIQDYLAGNYGPQQSKYDECPHGKFGWEDCINCIDEYFAGVLGVRND